MNDENHFKDAIEWIKKSYNDDIKYVKKNQI